MATIPLGNFDAPRVSVRQREGAPDLGAALAAPGRALEHLGEVGQHLADVGLAAQQRKHAEDAQQDAALKRVKMVNAAALVEIQTRQAAAEVEDDVRTGRVSWAKASDEFGSRLAKIQAPTIDGLDPVMTEQYNGVVQQHRLAATGMIDGVVRAAKIDDGRAQFGQTIDTFGKLAGQPGADVDKIVATVRATVPSFRQFGLDQATLDKSVQDFSDKVYANHANARSTAAGDDLAAIAALRKDLNDPAGYYFNRLDEDKRGAIDRALADHAKAVENRIEHAADRQAAIQDRALEAIDKQAASGYPATAEQRTAWATLFPPGSPRRADYESRGAGEAQVQELLRKPIGEQLATLAREQSQLLANGADAHDQANFARKQAAVQANVKLLAEQPLQFAATRMATPVPPIDLAALADPAQAGAIAASLQSRAATVAALRKQYGDQVQPHLLLPPEAKVLATVLDKLGPVQAAATFGKLHDAVGSEQNYDAVMAQLAPDNPVLAHAGRLAAAQRLYSPNKHDPSISPNVAQTILRGDALLNRTKGDKASDGNPKAFPMPPDKEIRAAFAEATGNAYAGDPARYERDLQFVRAYYAGRSAETGKISDELDDRVVRDAVAATLGNMVDVNDRTVAAPWGMEPGEFEDAWRAAATTALAGQDPQTQRNVLTGAQLLQLPSGAYALVQGRALVLGKDGKPVTFRVPRK
jgi:hypothetical protein